MLKMQNVKEYLLSLNSIKYNFNNEEFNRRSEFVYKMCCYYGHLSYSMAINMFENC